MGMGKILYTHSLQHCMIYWVGSHVTRPSWPPGPRFSGRSPRNRMSCDQGCGSGWSQSSSYLRERKKNQTDPEKLLGSDLIDFTLNFFFRYERQNNLTLTFKSLCLDWIRIWPFFENQIRVKPGCNHDWKSNKFTCVEKSLDPSKLLTYYHELSHLNHQRITKAGK